MGGSHCERRLRNSAMSIDFEYFLWRESSCGRWRDEMGRGVASWGVGGALVVVVVVVVVFVQGQQFIIQDKYSNSGQADYGAPLFLNSYMQVLMSFFANKRQTISWIR